MLMVIFLPRRVPGEWTRRGAKLCRDPEQGAARLDGPQLLRQWVGARQQQRRGEWRGKCDCGTKRASHVWDPGAAQATGHNPHTCAVQLFSIIRQTLRHITICPPCQSVEVMLNLSNVMMTTSSDGQINGHGLEWMLVRWGRRISGGVHLWTKLILFPSLPFRAQHFPH